MRIKNEQRKITSDLLVLDIEEEPIVKLRMFHTQMCGNGGHND